ncbi:dynein regulatory complex protein 10-like [Sitodiplosis mosellana]|uniref:dynein regulatory complex protein 10-like n=1 Tax=Sitodiplosis mosellana TaxID=263140 RepID=UPI0024438494|nr:dynein regulatory complex protein 10-like [Sitodiplosis mosellana]
MALCPTSINDSPSTNLIDNDSDDSYFCQVVFELIERIGREVAFYEDYESNISAKDFKHIELQIQAQRIEKILDLCIAKIPLVFYISSLIEQPRDHHLKLLFSRRDAQQIEQFTQKWSNLTADASNIDFIADLNVCLDIVENNDAAKEWQKNSYSGQRIIVLLTELRRIACHRIQMTASTEMARQKVLHQIWAANTKNTRKLNQIRREIEEDQLKMSSIATEKQDEIERHEFEKRRLIHKNSMALNRLVIESNKVMTEICEIGKCHQNAAQQSVLRAKEMFDTLRKNDICEENEAIQKKIDLENQLKDFLQVYDQEIGMRSQKFRECKKSLMQEAKTLDDWKEKYKTQEVLYNRIQADKEAEEEKRREQRILLFMMNRVARIIQRNYRRLLAQRKAKKKGKGKKGGKGKK